MVIGSGKIYLMANWVHSLKEKRMIVKSIIAKVHNKFNVSISEIENQDYHQTITLGIACISNDKRHVDRVMQNVIDYIEKITDAVIQDIEIEII
ncbi:hypothetical protein CLOACE_05680 [Clostridium acetireducens DSM 10703]|jgi:uncharacterized protein YlxP (DUF503 family)|uniref:DUF503 domain-containing protein n=1 Tax=Clostridium acetireducens DSM 10703 TaxID=1121290 RepID=A0A1E8F0X4_9CLOT|nr:DUF503 domain-containing protein [Clostridium acetireducens]OFI06982.1 hypothetical protein CLOACE_05680 [Clostridium acetireducens DSM 10703]